MTAATTRLPPMLSVEETAQNLDVSTRTVHRPIARRELPAHRVGSCLRISDEAMRSYLRRSRL
jgi:excisionase family DNA binding protein